MEFSRSMRGECRFCFESIDERATICPHCRSEKPQKMDALSPEDKVDYQEWLKEKEYEDWYRETADRIMNEGLSWKDRFKLMIIYTSPVTILVVIVTFFGKCING